MFRNAQVRRMLMGLCLLMVMLHVQGACAEERPFRIVISGFKPMWWEEDGQVKGMLFDLHSEALTTRMGIPIVFATMPWTRCQEEVQEGTADGLVTVVTPAIAEYAVATDPLYTVFVRPFANAEHPKLAELQALTTLEEFRPYQLLSYLGDNWTKTNLADAGFKVDFSAPTPELALQKLLEQRGDLWFANEAAMRYRIKEAGAIGKIVSLPFKMNELQYRLMVSKKSSYRDIVPKFNETLAAIRDEGLLQKIYEQWLGEEDTP